MTRLLWLVVVAGVLAVSLTACKSDSVPRVREQPGPPVTQGAGVAASAALVPIQSAEELMRSAIRALTQDVSSGRADFSWLIESPGLKLQGTGVYLVKAPSSIQIDEHYRGQGSLMRSAEANDSTIMALQDHGYLKSAAISKDWLVFTPDELGQDWQVLQNLLAAKSPLNLSIIGLNTIGDVTFVAEESISGQNYLHIRTQVDASNLMKAFADTYGSQGQVMFVGRFAGPVPFDMWLEPDTFLPRRAETDGKIAYQGAETTMRLTVDYTQLNGLSKFPNAPKNAKKVSELR